MREATLFTPLSAAPVATATQYPKTLAYIGLGANLGNAPQQLTAAVAALAKLPATALVAVSSLYSSAAIEVYEDQPDYYNAVAALATALTPEILLENLQAIEATFGRQRIGYHAPRTLDLDLLLYGAEVLNLPNLVVPHPRLPYRAFVLYPLLELDPNLVAPGLGPLATYLPTVADQTINPLGHWSGQALVFEAERINHE